jgi:hypothetical protein
MKRLEAERSPPGNSGVNQVNEVRRYLPILDFCPNLDIDYLLLTFYMLTNI